MRLSLLEVLPIGALLLLAATLPGCDLFGSDGGGSILDDVPPERLVAMVAVYNDTHENGAPVQRLVLADFENPSAYKVLSEAGTFATEPRFAPGKRRLLFVDQTGARTASDGQVTLLDLESGSVRPLLYVREDGRQFPLRGSLEGLAWEPDGSGFYSALAGPAGLTVAYHYDLATRRLRPFAQTQGGATVIPYGRKGQDSIFVISNERLREGGDRIPGFYFVDAETGAYLERIENEHLRFVRWEDPSRGGWRYSVYTPALDGKEELVAFRINNPENRGNLAVASLSGSSFEVYGASEEYIDTLPRWGPSSVVLFNRSRGASSPFQAHRVMVVDTETGEVRAFIRPEVIDGAAGLRTPDY